MLRVSKKITAILLVMMLIFIPALTQVLGNGEDIEIGSDIITTTENSANDQTSLESEHQEPDDPEAESSNHSEEQTDYSEDHQVYNDPVDPVSETQEQEDHKDTQAPEEPSDNEESEGSEELPKPAEPQSSEETTMPDESEEPTEELEPCEPEQPENPAELEEPQEPPEPQNPENPVVPNEPGEPIGEPEPQEPNPAENPVNPEQPLEPINPDEIPIEPITPIEPLPIVPVIAGNPNFSITVDTDKDVYYIGETIEYDVMVINTGDVDLENLSACVYCSLGTSNELVGLLTFGQETRFSGKFRIESDFTEPLLEIEVTAKAWFDEVPIDASASCQVQIESNPFIELMMPPGMEGMASLNMFRSLERETTFDYGPPKSVFLPDLVKSAGTQDTIAVNKTAGPSSVCRTYDVRLEITGVPAPAPVDVVLVIDRSGSMDARVGGWLSPTVMDYAKNAAKAFTDNVLADSNNRVAVVSFTGPRNIGDIGAASDAKQEIGLSNNATSVKAAINSITTYYGTNIEAGFLMAKNILESSGRQNANKVIVLLTDGVATCSIGNPAGPNEPTSHNAHTRAAYQAGQSCWDVAMVFTVGLFNQVPNQSKTVARETLQWAQNSGYYEATGAPDLSGIYDEISGQLGYSAIDAVVTDVINENFELVSASITPSPNAPASYDAATRTITWRPGTITDLAELNYKIRAKDGVKGNNLPTNDNAILRYTDINGTPNIEQTFPVPTVNVIGVDAGPDSVIVVGDVINIGQNLQVYGYAPFEYLWSNDTDPDWSSSNANPALEPEEDTVYTIQITDNNGCKASDSILVTVKKGKIIIRKVVSPGIGGVDTDKEFVLHIDGPSGKEWNTLIRHNETKQIGNLRPGAYEITEVVPMDYKLVSILNPNFNITREMIANDTVVTVTVTNKKVNDSWFRDETETDNFFTVVVSYNTNNAKGQKEDGGSMIGMESLEAILPDREEDPETVEESSE
ncbi:VWA domain-containing protein [Tepidanaerobacter sp. EBM-38]|uniref:VWA domain-containing protein n=1 Tax=Tepidanaerobacter sp. EBM-38 TaxID=1918496 RepID=UPI000AA4A2FF|nr:VWA domain-containing protein [Tepidanaerobacter sp. EBM-38]